MTDYQEVFVKNLKMFRKNRNLTQAVFAELCDVSNGTIGNIECLVTKPSFDLILKMAEVLEVSPADFFNVIDNQSMKTIPDLEASLHLAISEVFSNIGKLNT